MSFVWSAASSICAVLVIFLAQSLCDDTFSAVALKIGNSGNQSNQNSWSSQTWPVVGQRYNANNNFNTQGDNNSDWPKVSVRNQRTNVSSSHNSNNPVKPEQSTSNSYVRSQVEIWNSRLNPNNSYATALNSRNDRPSTGIQFSDSSKGPAVSNTKISNPQAVTDDELREFSEKLLLKDENNAARYVRINFQGRTTSRSTNDEAPLPLLTVGADAYNIPTISKLQPLYDNYVVEVNVNEDYTNQEKEEENSFLRAVLNTDVMREARHFLLQKGVISQNERDFQNLIHEMWFHPYSRGRRKVGSSAFEHVFLAELKNKDVLGLHNWLYFEREEANNRANYLGFLKKIDLGDKGAILKFNFNFHGVNKPVGSMFIGTSPEFEIALYSICFILRADRICPLKLNERRFIIRTYTFNYDGKKLIGSAFPEI